MNDPEFNDPEISDNLHRIVPDDLSTAGLVDGARKKRNKRKGAVGAVAALAIVGLAVPVAINLQDDSIIAQPAATSSPSPDGQQTEVPAPVSVLPGAQACYNEDGTPISWTQTESAPAEPGAVKAWLCGDYSPETGQGSVGPIEPLTSGLDDIVANVQSADVIDLTVTTCMSDYLLSFNTVLEYADGTRRIIGGDRHGCQATYDGGVARAGAEDFYGELITAWEKQRETDTGDWAVPALCPGPTPLMQWAGDAVQGAICAEDVDGSGGRSAAYLDDELLESVVGTAFTVLETMEENPPSTSPEQRYWITVSNKFSDHVTFVRHEDGVFGASDSDGNQWFWEPTPELAARLDEALANAGSSNVPPAGQPVDPSTVPGGPATPVAPGTPLGNVEGTQPWVADACQAAASGELMSTDIPDGVLPDGADRVWLCTNGVAMMGGAPVPPMEALDDADLVSDALTAFNSLEPLPADQPCTMELGPSYLVMHEYSDGTRYAVEVQDYGCDSVVAGDTVNGNSGLYMDTLLDLWGTQRTDRATQQTRPGPLCPLTSSVFAPAPDEATFTSGVACVGWGDIDGVSKLSGEEVALPEGLVSEIATQLAEAPLEPADIGFDGDSIVLMTTAGDPFVLQHQGDGTFVWSKDESTGVWKPTGTTAETLESVFG